MESEKENKPSEGMEPTDQVLDVSTESNVAIKSEKHETPAEFEVSTVQDVGLQGDGTIRGRSFG
jgi:hypothetical protein